MNTTTTQIPLELGKKLLDKLNTFPDEEMEAACLQLIKDGADLKMYDMNEGATALIKASINGYLNITKALLEAGADINQKQLYPYERTALMRASMRGQLDVVKMLLDHGADTEIRGSNGHTALTMAASSPWPEVAQTLIDAGANPDVKDGDGISAFNHAANPITQNIIATAIHDRITAQFKEADAKGTNKRRKILRPAPGQGV